MAKCDMGEMRSPFSSPRMKYVLNGPKALFEQMIYGMPI